jgi:hypothetical protein
MVMKEGQKADQKKAFYLSLKLNTTYRSRFFLGIRFSFDYNEKALT